MPLFDLGQDVTISHRVQASRPEAARLAEQVLKSYEPLGYQVSIQANDARTTAKVTDAQGTAIDVEVHLEDDGGATTVDIRLAGGIFVGGMKGMMANDAMVQRVAREQLEGLVESTFSAVQPKAAEPPEEAPEAVEDAPPKAPEQGPPGTWKNRIERILLGDFDDASEAEKTRAVEDLIQACAVAAGAVTIQPIPMVDTALITPIQIGMVQAIGKIRGYTLDAKSVIEILSVFGASIVTQNVIIAAAKLVPFAGWAVSISMAYALTYAIGVASNRYFESGRGASRAELTSLFDETFARKKKEKQAAASQALRLKDKLEQLTEAFEADLLTEEEFAKKKEVLLRSL